MAKPDFTHRIPELVAWINANIVNRIDVWGGPACGRDGGRMTMPAKALRGKVQLSSEIIEQHFISDDTRTLLGLHTISPQNTCKWIAVDIDAHNDAADTEANWRAAQAWYARLGEMDFLPLLFDSNGAGGYHLIALFSKPMPSTQAYSFVRNLVADHVQYGLSDQPETFPKQKSLTTSGKGSFGSWLRLFGQHHSREHWSRVWNGSQWLDGEAAIDFILKVKPSDTAIVPQVFESPVPQRAQRAVPPIVTNSGGGDIDGRIRKYISKVENRTGGSGRSDQAFRAAAFLVRDMAQSADDALRYLLDWDQGNNPALGCEKLKEIIGNATQYGQRAIGEGLGSSSDGLYERLVKKSRNQKTAQSGTEQSESPEKASSIDRILELLRNHQPLFVTARGQIHFSDGQELTPAQCSGLPGSMELLRSTPEWLRQIDNRGTVKPTTEFTLAKELFGIAGRRLIAELPAAERHSDTARDEIECAIIMFLIEPRLFYDAAGVPVNLAYKRWLNLLSPNDLWCQCFGHEVFGRSTGNGIVRLAISPEFLVNKIPRLFKAAKTIESASALLMKLDFVKRQNDQKGSYRIRCDGRRHRVWELTPHIIELACGTVSESVGEGQEEESE